MKTIFIAVSSAVIGILTTEVGLGWFNSDGSVNTTGAAINIISIHTMIVATNVMWPRKR